MQNRLNEIFKLIENYWNFSLARVFAIYFNHQDDSFPVLKTSQPCSLGTSLNIERGKKNCPVTHLFLKTILTRDPLPIFCVT